MLKGKPLRKKFLVGACALLVLLCTLISIYFITVQMPSPIKEQALKPTVSIQKVGGQYFTAGNGSWLRKNDKGIWEMYLTGGPYELGLSFGALGQILQAEKESAFIGEIENRIPSAFYLNFLKYMVGWFNRDLDEYVPEEYLKEIYGSSRYMADSFDYISPKYHRGLSYHAAHDIGHALQNMNLVACTAFAVKDEKTDDGKLLVGRNFDFYFGEEFAKDPMVAFYNPADGYQFMSITWAGFSGVVSGMNEKGLTITLNAAKSAIPSKGKTPVSLLARKILQYASDIGEAYDMAKKHDTFVAESFLISSKTDGKAVVIEKTPEKTAVYKEADADLIVTNHYQSEELLNDPLNQEYLAEGVSDYRYGRVQELLDSLSPLNAEKAVFLLRDQKGLKGKNIGLSNEKAINQLIAHHSIIFSPEDMLVWVSTPPYQLGDYLAYDLGRIFASEKNGQSITYIDSLSIAPDPFLFTDAYTGYKNFVCTKDKIQRYLAKGDGALLTAGEEKQFVQSNPEGFLTYYYLGDYKKELKDWGAAKKYYEAGLQLEVAKESERGHMLKNLKECVTHINSGN